MALAGAASGGASGGPQVRVAANRHGAEGRARRRLGGVAAATATVAGRAGGRRHRHDGVPVLLKPARHEMCSWACAWAEDAARRAARHDPLVWSCQVWPDQIVHGPAQARAGLGRTARMAIYRNEGKDWKNLPPNLQTRHGPVRFSEPGHVVSHIINRSRQVGFRISNGPDEPHDRFSKAADSTHSTHTRQLCCALLRTKLI